MSDPGGRANLVGVAVNVGLAVTKLAVGTFAHSAALVADGFNSAGDVLATGIGYVGYRWASVPPDEGHPYGHGNVESAAGLAIGAILLATGVFVAIDGVRSFAAGPMVAPDPRAIGVALGTAVTKAALAVYTQRVGKRLNAPSLLAAAADHRADVAVAMGVAVGIGAARMGFPWVDPLAAVLVGAWIVRQSFAPLATNAAVLLDASPPDVAARVRQTAGVHPGVVRVVEVRVHPLGSYYVADVVIAVAADLSLRDAHALAHGVIDRLKTEVEHVRDVRIHVDPA